MNYKRAFEVLNKLKPTGDMFYSPISLNTALSLYSDIIEDGVAKDEIRAFIEQDYSDYKATSPCYNINNILWLDKNKNFNTSGISFPVRKIDMTAKDATKIKNDYVNQVTNGFIPSTPTEFNKLTVMDLMNVVYFKDNWASGQLTFDEDKTNFHNFDGTTASIKLMKYKSHGYFENDTCYVIHLPYKSGLMCYLVYPKNTIETVVLDGLKPIDEQINIKFPSFETSVNFDITKFASQLGLSNFENSVLTFDKEFSRPSISHSAKIKMDTFGTVAAAVTEIVRTRGICLDRPMELIFDKPFAYFILDSNNDTLFMGRLAKL